MPHVYPDPRGEPSLKQEIAAHLALARGVKCDPSQIFITAGFSGGLGVALGVLGMAGRRAWVENPGFPSSRKALQLAQLEPVPVPVDDEGMDVSRAVEMAPDAALALVTPGQQAPTGAVLSLARRVQLIEWAAGANAWIIEDDYLGDLQLRRRAAPALASLDSGSRVIHIGSFSKTISPSLRIGFIVAPRALADRFAETIACLAPAPDAVVQLAVADFMREGHYMRHLRQMKRIYAARSNAIYSILQSKKCVVQSAGLAILLRLPDGLSDVEIAKEARMLDLAPAPLSPWFVPSSGNAFNGLLLGVATAVDDQISGACDRLYEVIQTRSSQKMPAR
ncbi:PLP-dependent aminotransferase family protein [Paraburkholderia sp. DHOC27]|uniref:aminotransferase-like domain-containing protein n=1 Tax=Paraburkholderia sp. DHOC27 TaxID=2303330 RepID=UPI00286EC983|nr:PLP-dependent aminotransferase family protein [Paraburkholderia sp. DHOC27]